MGAPRFSGKLVDKVHMIKFITTTRIYGGYLNLNEFVKQVGIGGTTLWNLLIWAKRCLEHSHHPNGVKPWVPP